MGGFEWWWKEHAAFWAEAAGFNHIIKNAKEDTAHSH